MFVQWRNNDYGALVDKVVAPPWSEIYRGY